MVFLTDGESYLDNQKSGLVRKSNLRTKIVGWGRGIILFTKPTIRLPRGKMLKIESTDEEAVKVVFLTDVGSHFDNWKAGLLRRSSLTTKMVGWVKGVILFRKQTVKMLKGKVVNAERADEGAVNVVFLTDVGSHLDNRKTGLVRRSTFRTKMVGWENGVILFKKHTIKMPKGKVLKAERINEGAVKVV